jgi:hypothetical protein
MPSHDMVWLVIEPTPLKNINVSWDDDIPNIWKTNITMENEKMTMENVPNHQPEGQGDFHNSWV